MPIHDLGRGQTALEAGATYVLDWQQDGKPERWRWHVLDADLTRRLDAAHTEIATATPDPEQRRIITAMLFEQMKLRVNMEFELAQQPGR